jgi:hypothetical protein
MIPKVFHAIKPQDFTMRPIQTHKRFVIRRSDLYSGSAPQTSSGYRIWEGLYIGEKLKIGSSTYPTNSFDGTYKHIVWKSIDTQFYRFPHDPQATLEHSNKRFTYKHLDLTASILAIPYMDFGESILPGSIEITGSGFNLTDDKNGNLYDVSLSTGSYSDRKDLVAYWGFNDLFRKVKNINDDSDFERTKINYESGIFDPEEGSIAVDLHLTQGVPCNGTSSGIGVYFDLGGHILTLNRNEFNFTKEDDFTISFWLKWIFVGSNVSTIISKNTIISEQVYGNLDKYNRNDLIQKTWHVSSSTEYKPVDIYPYRFEINDLSGKMSFKRSDGTKIIHLSGSIDLDDSTWHHYATVKSGSNLYLYQDGTIVQSGSEVDYNPHNKHSLMFGSDNFDQLNAFGGYLDEIRIYNKGLSTATIATLADNSTMGMYQTSIVGNAFYRSGNIIVSSLNPKYNKVFQNDFTIKYRGTHTIFNYEILCRIKKGDFNLTLNPTARQGPFSDLLIDDFTGSFNDSSLSPYFHTVGFYNDRRELLAVGKLNQPIKSRSDVDINIITSFHG